MKITKNELKKKGWENLGEQGWQKGNDYLVVTIFLNSEFSNTDHVASVRLSFREFSKTIGMNTMKEVNGLTDAFNLS